MTQHDTLTNLSVAPTDAIDLAGVDRTALARLDLNTISVHDLADWLRDHGTAHLSAIERIELAERLTRRRFIIGAGGLLGAAALGACGAGEEVADAPTASETTRMVETEKGPVQVPINPQRVVAPYFMDVDVAIVLELPLVGAGTAFGLDGQTFAFYQPKEALDDVAPLAIFPSAPYEQIAQLDPDLIIVQHMHDEDGYALLSEIAPTIWYKQAQAAGWGQGVEAVASATGREKVWQSFLEEFDPRVAQIRSRVVEQWGGQKLMLVNPGQNAGSLRVLQADNSNLGFLYDEVGFERASLVPVNFEERRDQGLDTLSLERLDLLSDVDILLLWRSPATEGTGRLAGEWDDLTASPLFQQIPAVRTGNVFDFNAELFYGSPLTANAVLDFVERTLLD